TEASIETVTGVLETKIVTWEGTPGVRVAMGEPTFKSGSPGKLDRALMVDGESAPAYAVSMGNPHVVVFVKRDPAKLEVPTLAATVAAWKIFDSEPNVEFAHV